MRNTIFSGAMLALATAVAAPTAATAADGGNTATCDAKYYSNLVGKDLDRARSITSSSYRLLPAGAAAGQANARRMTIVYDANSRTIVDVTCG